MRAGWAAVQRRHRHVRHRPQVHLSLGSREPDLQLLLAGASAAAPTATSPASAASSAGDADVPGRLGDPGNGHLPGSAASASAAATGAGTRSLSGLQGKETPARAIARAGFLLPAADEFSGAGA